MSTIGLFDVLREVGKKNYFIWDELTVDQRRAFHPYVLIQWMRGSSIPIERLQSVNQYFFELPLELQFRLLATVSPRPSSYHWKWTSPKADPESEQMIDAVQSYLQLDRSTARAAIEFMDDEALTEIKETNGNTEQKRTRKKGTRKK
jgi:hypothetical protein